MELMGRDQISNEWVKYGGIKLHEQINKPIIG